jgi:hypothetical protein
MPSNYYGHFCGILSHAKTIEIFTGCKQEIKINIYKLDWQRRRKWNMKNGQREIMEMFYANVLHGNANAKQWMNGWLEENYNIILAK